MAEHRGRFRPWAGLLLLTLLPPFAPAPAAAQSPDSVRLEVTVDPSTHAPTVFTRHILDDTPWLSILRQGLPLRFQYRLEVWRSREAWLDEAVRTLEWTIVVRHEPLLDQFTVYRFGPFRANYEKRTLGTSGALGDWLERGLKFPVVAPRDPGRYYYRGAVSVATLSDNDLDKVERALRNEVVPGDGEGGGLAERVRRLVLGLAGLPTATLTYPQSEQFEVR